MYKHADITEKIIGVFYDVYNELGHGFLESIYERAMALALSQAGLNTETQKAITVNFRGRTIGDFRADIVVENKVILELKAGKALDASHEAQLINYLRATDIEVGLLLNFDPKAEIKRFAFENTRKQDLRSSA